MSHSSLPAWVAVSTLPRRPHRPMRSEPVNHQPHAHSHTKETHMMAKLTHIDATEAPKALTMQEW